MKKSEESEETDKMPPRVPDALMRHIMSEKIKNQHIVFENAVMSAFPHGVEASPNADADGSVRMTESRIYVGLNDAKTGKQEFETGKYLDIMKGLCRSYHVAFTVGIEQGGYYSEDGDYTEEVSLVLTLFDAGRDRVLGIAKDLRSAFRQESVLVTEDHIDCCFLK